METILVSLGGGLLQAFEPLNLFMIFAGCLAGLLVGCMPVSYTHLTLPTS